MATTKRKKVPERIEEESSLKALNEVEVINPVAGSYKNVKKGPIRR